MSSNSTENEIIRLLEARSFIAAAEACTRALKERPEDVTVLNLLGVAFREMNQLEKSLQYHLQALSRSPLHPETLLYLAELLLRARRFDESLKAIQNVLTLNPTFLPAHEKLAHTLCAQSKYQEAEQALRNALKIDPRRAELWNQLGITLRKLRKFDEAILAYQTAISIRPDFFQALNNLGAAHQSLNRTGDAIRSFEKAIACNPSYASALVNLAQTNLLVGNYATGWRLHENRWKLLGLDPTRGLAQPLWDGNHSLNGCTLLIHSEQGLGDTLQFIRYAPVLNSRGARIIAEVQPALLEIVKSVSGISAVFPKGETPSDFDFHCPLMSLPLAMKNFSEADFPTKTPYVYAPHRPTIGSPGPGTRPRVGLVWRGNPEHVNDENRSMNWNDLRPLLVNEAAMFVNLQLPLNTEETRFFESNSNAWNPMSAVKNYGDTAAIVAELDLVISVDTSVAHLAGAMGKPVWILLPFSPDWRWQLNRNDSIWYPTAQLFRQQNPGDWTPVISQIAESLRTFSPHPRTP